MVEFKKLDDELYVAQYGNPGELNCEELWNKIKTNKEALEWAIKVKKDKFGERDIVNGLSICNCMLIDYKTVNKDIYQKLINTIYSNEQIARIVQDGYSNGGFSYLLMSLWNYELVLTDEQKTFAVNEAMNKIGTRKYYELKEKRSMELENRGINNNETVIIDIDGCKNPIGLKSYHEYFDSLVSSLSDTQAHGRGEYDIRYCILRNPNWSIQEKSKLLYDFYPKDEIYDEYLEQWEWGVVNDSSNNQGETIDILFYEYSYDELLKFYDGDKEKTDEIYDEIQFCETMKNLRPKQIMVKQKINTLT